MEEVYEYPEFWLLNTQHNGMASSCQDPIEKYTYFPKYCKLKEVSLTFILVNP